MQQQQQKILEDLGYGPSFSCYSSDTTTTTAVAKVIREEAFYEFVDDFEFSLSSDEDVSVKEIDSRALTVFPVFNLQVNADVADREIKVRSNEMYASSSAVTDSLRKLFIGEQSSSSSSEALDELESPRFRSYCVWRPTKWKKTNSTGSVGSKMWIFRYLLRRTNSEGKKPMVLLSSKKLDSPKQKGTSAKILKAQYSPKQFYVQRRAENEAEKRKSYLPYRTDVVGLMFANANRMLPF